MTVVSLAVRLVPERMELLSTILQAGCTAQRRRKNTTPTDLGKEFEEQLTYYIEEEEAVNRRFFASAQERGASHRDQRTPKRAALDEARFALKL